MGVQNQLPENSYEHSAHRAHMNVGFSEQPKSILKIQTNPAMYYDFVLKLS